MIETSRRKFIGSLIALVAAPAIVRVSSIMPVKAPDNPWIEILDARWGVRATAFPHLLEIQQIQKAALAEIARSFYVPEEFLR